MFELPCASFGGSLKLRAKGLERIERACQVDGEPPFKNCQAGMQRPVIIEGVEPAADVLEIVCR